MTEKDTHLTETDEHIHPPVGSADIIGILAPQLGAFPNYDSLKNNYRMLLGNMVSALKQNPGRGMSNEIKDFEENYKFIEDMDVFRNKTVENSGGLLNGTNKLDGIYTNANNSLIAVNQVVNEYARLEQKSRRIGIDSPPLFSLKQALEGHIKYINTLLEQSFNHSFEAAQKRNLLGEEAPRGAAYKM